MMTTTHQAAFASRPDLRRYGDNAHLLFALETKFQIDDIHTVAANALTDGNDDKKCDVVYVDSENGIIVVAQGYVSRDNTKPAAPAQKAADLNTAASWLLGRPLEELPERLRSAAKEVRDAISTNSVRSIQFWYVHNLPGSRNVKNELRTVEQTIRSVMRSSYPDVEIQEITALEVDVAIMEEWYQALQAPILITNSFDVPIPGGYAINGDDWEAFVTAVPASWLRSIYLDHKEKLFSANIRGYLGSRKSGTNINHGIKKTASESPTHFWVFNNGLTALVHDFVPVVKNDGGSSILIEGISIVNGAQTTGALGTLELEPNDQAMVPARFVKCKSRDTIQRIIEFNNRQNQIEASDFRSNDAIQRRLRDEFALIPETSYTGGRRGGLEESARRVTNVIPSYTAAQALAAFHQDPVVAYNQKSQLWISDTLYPRYFGEQTHAEHIVFAYSLLRSVEDKKLSLIDELDRNDALPDAKNQQLMFLRNRGANFLFTSAIAKCLEIFIDQAIPNLFRVSFSGNVSPQVAQTLWAPVVEATIPLCTHLLPAVSNGLRNSESAAQAIGTFSNLVGATKFANEPIYRVFKSHIRIRN